MREFRGQSLSWQLTDGVCELALHREPANEIGTALLAELEQFVAALDALQNDVRAVILYSRLRSGFSAGADLRELYRRMRGLTAEQRVAGVRQFLERIHAVLNRLDAAPATTIAAVHGVCFGGGLELALACDVMVADKMARFCFPELRLGILPGFGGIPRLKRDVGNAVVRDLLLTGRSINAQRAHAVGLVAQLAAEGQALAVARATAQQAAKFDSAARSRAKQFSKPIPYEELQREIAIFCELFARPAVEEGLRKFVESSAPLPYLP
ncbi:MAG: enoyl-CoA hydratase/isomerase family protein [Acidobacteriia bacterium]|jgi:enoyl-CoA hydratase/carnithine racemase|nr:enoyl-CoA hydratase/isomerase family protein [Terriglobia bacterium]